MNALAAVLTAFDDAWSHKWESLQSVLERIGAEEAAWQAPCYAAETQEEGWPAPGTIAWQVAHLAHCKRYYAAIVRARAEAEAPEVAPRAILPDFEAERAALGAAHREQRAAIVGIGDDDLEVVACGKMPLGEFLFMTIRHDAWHASQIALVRRLHRNRAEGPDGP